MRYDKFYFHALKTSVDYFIIVGKIGDSPVVVCNILMWIIESIYLFSVKMQQLILKIKLS